MAIGNREAERIPALAVVMKASSAAMAIMAPPAGPRRAFAPKDMGMREPLRAEDPRIPTVTLMTNTYSTDTTTKARIMPRGMLLRGSLTSSAMLATLVTPPKETNTKPAVASTEPVITLAEGIRATIGHMLIAVLAKSPMSDQIKEDIMKVVSKRKKDVSMKKINSCMPMLITQFLYIPPLGIMIIVLRVI